MDDDRLMLDARKGSKAAMELLVLRHYDEIHAYAARRTGSAHAAEDIAQITFEKLVRALPGYRPMGRFRQWLFTIASNEANEYFRRRKDAGPLPEDISAIDSDIVRLLIKKEEYVRVRRCMLALPRNQQEVLVLFYYHDMSLKDIAQITGANINTVKSRLRLGVEKLRDGLEVERDEGQMG